MVHFDSLRGRIERPLPTLDLRLEETDVENSKVGQRGSGLEVKRPDRQGKRRRAAGPNRGRSDW